MTAQLRHRRGLALGPRSAKALSNFDSAVPLLRTKKETEAHQRPRIAAPATGPACALGPREPRNPVRVRPNVAPIAAGGEPGEEGRYEDRNMLTRTSARAGPRSPSGEGHCLIETVASRRSGRRGGEGPAAPWSPRRRPVVDADRSGGGGPRPRGFHSTLPRRARFGVGPWVTAARNGSWRKS